MGRSDIVIKERKNRRAVVIEAKIASSEDRMEAECQNVIKQIEENQYARKIERNGFRKVIRFGIEDGKSYKSIGEVLSISGERVKQIAIQASRKIMSDIQKADLQG